MAEGGLDLGADQLGTLNLGKTFDLAALLRCALVGHVACCTLRAKVDIGIVDRKQTVLDRRTDVAICLAVPEEETARVNIAQDKR